MIMVMTRDGGFYSCCFFVFNESSPWSLWAPNAKVIKELEKLLKIKADA